MSTHLCTDQLLHAYTVMRTIRDFGGWKVAQARFFADGGVFDRIYSGPKR